MPKVHIAALIMCKNEKKRLHVTLDSIKDCISSLIVFDTGSTDNTIDILKEFSEKNKIPLRLKQGTFVNFQVSRNESLDWAYTFEDVDYLLLLDVNDELRGADRLIEVAKQNLNTDFSAFLVCQQWWSFALDKYFNVRLVKPRKGWYYKGVVHEYIHTDIEANNKIFRLNDDIVLYQDRTQDDDKTGKRFTRDKELLLAEYKKDPTEPRTCFYLAQTCSCLRENSDAYYYYKIRTTLEGFFEERFHAYLKCGELSEMLCLDWSESMGWYMKAFEFLPRAEPLFKITEHYNYVKNWKLAHTFATLCCSLKYPDDLILFVDKLCYDYKRWHILGIVAFYAESYIDGKQACLKAIEYGKENPLTNTDIDKSNLKFYDEKLFEIQNGGGIAPQPQAVPTNQQLTKTKFIETKVIELMNDPKNINCSKKQLINRANALWKINKKK
jgi:glycosyltransferase involved in cell wall biosynthesis